MEGATRHSASLATAIASIALLAAAPLGAQPAAAEPPTAAALRAGLAGRWTGHLGYRDYQSDKMFELPVATTISAVPDAVTLIRTSKFDEGRGRAPVWITTVTIDDAKAGTVESATFRAGRPAELQRESVSVAAYRGPTRWTIVYSQTATDDDKPAEIRVTETRDGADLVAVKEVRPAGSSAPWQFRNQTRLTRIGR